MNDPMTDPTVPVDPGEDLGDWGDWTEDDKNFLLVPVAPTVKAYGPYLLGP